MKITTVLVAVAWIAIALITAASTVFDYTLWGDMTIAALLWPLCLAAVGLVGAIALLARR